MDARNGKGFLVGVTLATLLWGCVSASFSYKWYYPEFVSYDGKLLGARPSDDLDAHVCEKDPITHESGCVVMLKAEFKALTLDYMDKSERLQTCEAQ